ncbi:hypothetical protein BSQ39_01470 [Loigolactobacillus backii]|nr:hypothetical protein BSQ39_01470 [Loigolactobacillus backii]
MIDFTKITFHQVHKLLLFIKSKILPTGAQKMLKKLLYRYHNFFSYMVFGFLASIINILAYWLFRHFFLIQYLLANALAWLIATLFGFFTNKSLVFRSKYTSWRALQRELVSFLSLRIFSLGIDSLIMFSGISLLKLASMPTKIADQLIVGIVNYLFSRWVFETSNHTKLHHHHLKK